MDFQSLCYAVAIYLCIINIYAFLIYSFDKYCAIKKHRRVSEKKLLFLSFIFGSVGAMFAMSVFHHKTKKRKFKYLVPFFLVMQMAFLYILYFKFCQI